MSTAAQSDYIPADDPDDPSIVDETPTADPRLGGLDSETLQKIHDKGMKRFKAAKKAWSPAHDAYNEDQRFADGDQWDAKVVTERTAANLSVLVYNQLPAKYKFVVNNARRAVPGIKVAPVSNGANKNTAKVFDGLVKYIQDKYNAKHAYIHALTCAVIGGLGAWKVLPVETDEDEYDIEIQRILDPTTVFMDPTAVKQDFCDAEYVFVMSWMPKDIFDAEYGEETSGFEKKQNSTMFTQDSVQILEYWVRNHQTKRVEQYIMNGERVLQANTGYLGKYLPIVLLTGEEKHIEGERKYKGIVRDVKDMQILLNLSKSKTADYLGRTGNQTWLVEEDQIEGYEDIWLSANVNGAAVLPYKATAGGAPQRLDAPPPPAGFQQISSEADADIRAAIGIRDPLEPIPANVASKTVEMQISQSNIGTLEFIDKLKDAVKFNGNIVVDLIPHYFNYPHIREVMGLDNQVTTVQLNAPYEENGEQVMHDLTVGRYAVTISDGPSYESQRSEASDKLLECAKVYPQFLQLAGDIVFRNMDFEGANEIADRLRAQLPPNILAASSASNADGASQAQVLMNQMNAMQQQLAQMQQENDQLHGFLQQAQQEKATKVAEIGAETQAQIQLENIKFEHARQLKLLDLQGKGQHIQLKGDIDALQAQADNDAEAQRDLVDNHTDIFIAEIKHNVDQLAAPTTPVTPTITF